jgi:hypothetical protein
MPEYADIYVLSKATDEYEVPQYSDSPKIVFRQASELINHCCANLREVHSIYWRTPEGSKPEHAMVFFLPDEHIIYGVSTDAADEAQVRYFLARIKRHFKDKEALLYHEACPPESAVAFREEVQKRKS